MTPLMGADLNNIVKTQSLSDDHVQFLVYQMFRGLKYVHSAGIIHRVRVQLFNTLRPRQCGRHFPDDILKCIFLNEDILISNTI